MLNSQIAANGSRISRMIVRGINVGAEITNYRKATIGIIGLEPKLVAAFNVELVKQANAMGLKTDQAIPEILAIGIKCESQKYLSEMAEVCHDFGCDFVVSPDQLGNSNIDKNIRASTRISVAFPRGDQEMRDFANEVMVRACDTKNVRRPQLYYGEGENFSKKISDNLKLDEKERGARINQHKRESGEYSVFRNNAFVGVIGGAGPWASSSLCELLSGRAVNFVHFSVNSAPGKHKFEMGTGMSYIEHYKNAVGFFRGIKAKLYAVPCNTAHTRLKDFMEKDVDKVIDIRQAVLVNNSSVDGFILLGTNATVGIAIPEGSKLQRGIYEDMRLKIMPHSKEFIIPSENQQKIIMDAIFSIKAGEINESKAKIDKVVDEIRSAYNNPNLPVVLGCTELPLVYETTELVAKNYIDPAESLAKEVQHRMTRYSNRLRPKPSVVVTDISNLSPVRSDEQQY